MSPLIRALLVAIACAAPAAAETPRVVLADADPELQRAVRATLAPWRLEVIVEVDVRPRDATSAQHIGDAKAARFVVWREGTDLVVFDRERGLAEHRAAPAGPLDAASAAAAALTVKTLMRLPPPPAEVVEPPVERPAVVDVEPARSGLAIRVQGGVAARLARGGKTNELGGRASLGVFVRPSALPLRIGIVGELGTDTDVQGAGFKGSWRDFCVVGLASWSLAIARDWALEPFAGGGVVRSNLDGTEAMTPRHERETLPVIRAGVALRIQLGMVSVGGVVTVDANLGTPTYTRMGMGTRVFAVPEAALSLGFVVAADLGR